MMRGRGENDPRNNKLELETSACIHIQVTIEIDAYVQTFAQKCAYM